MSEQPVLRLVRGDATPEEIAAVVTAMAATAGPGEAAEEPATTSVWSAPGHAHRQIRATFTPSRDGWRTSFWPR